MYADLRHFTFWPSISGISSSFLSSVLLVICPSSVRKHVRNAILNVHILLICPPNYVHENISLVIAIFFDVVREIVCDNKL